MHRLHYHLPLRPYYPIPDAPALHILGCFVCLVDGVLLCCFLCPSCPGAKCCKSKHNDDGVMVQQPVPIASMGAPRAQAAPVFQPQGVPTGQYSQQAAQYPAKPIHQPGLDQPPPYVPTDHSPTAAPTPADPHSSGANSYVPSYEPTTTQSAGGGIANLAIIRTSLQVLLRAPPPVVTQSIGSLATNYLITYMFVLFVGPFCANCGQRSSVVSA